MEKIRLFTRAEDMGAQSALKNSIPSRARVLSARVPFPRLEIPSGYSSVRKPKFALEISCRPLESDLFNTLSTAAPI